MNKGLYLDIDIEKQHIGHGEARETWRALRAELKETDLTASCIRTLDRYFDQEFRRGRPPGRQEANPRRRKRG
jgi:hypothetical protein